MYIYLFGSNRPTAYTHANVVRRDLNLSLFQIEEQKYLGRALGCVKKRKFN